LLKKSATKTTQIILCQPFFVHLAIIMPNAIMEIDISKHIVDLLHEHDVVSLPGLGSFVGTYKSSQVDQVTGTVTPPAKTITFDDNLRMDDGLLIDTIGKTYGITFDTATTLVEDYVHQIRELLERREIVSFPNLGRLYRDFEQNLQFLPEATNFNVESHGLPEIKAYPIAKPEPEPEVEPVIVENQTSGTPQSAAVPLGILINNWLRDNVLIVGIVVTLAVVIMLFLFIRGPLDESTSRQDTLVNVSPPSISDEQYKNDFPPEELPKEQRQPLTSDKQGAVVDDGTYQEDASVAENKPSSKTKTTPAKTTPKVIEKPSITPPAPEPTPVGDKTGIIAIGTFKDQGNVAKLVQKISAAGYTPYKTSAGDLTKVGVQFNYSTPAELNSMLSQVRKKFEPGAIIIKR